MSTEEKKTDVDRWVIFINGPPGVGKDTAAKAIAAYIAYNEPWKQPKLMKIAEPIKKATHALWGLDTWTEDRYDDPKMHKEKDEPNNAFNGATPRQAYIATSTYAKEAFGEEFFGWIARRRMVVNKIHQVFIFSDCGFADELGPIVDLVGEEHVLVIQLTASGKTFENDSRSFIGPEMKARYPKITVRNIHNEFGDIQDRELFKVYCKGAVKGFLNLYEKDY